MSLPLTWIFDLSDLRAQELQQTQDLLQAERTKSEKLQRDLQRIQSDIVTLSAKTKQQETVIAGLEAEKANSLQAQRGIMDGE